VRLMRPLGLLLVLSAAACSGTGPAGSGPVASTTAPSAPTSSAGLATPAVATASAPEPSGGTTTGDVPDNAVFLTYHGPGPAFSIQYVEGWQVTPQPDGGVEIRDKDSSETVAIQPTPADLGRWIAATDLPNLRTQPGFSLVKQDRVKVGPATYDHVAYHVTSPPDPVTGKSVPLSVDRYYVPGPAGLAVVSLSTPDGVDNVDAFRQMITSFAWG
jgi:hypothetical protein